MVMAKLNMVNKDIGVCINGCLSTCVWFICALNVSGQWDIY